MAWYVSNKWRIWLLTSTTTVVLVVLWKDLSENPSSFIAVLNGLIFDELPTKIKLHGASCPTNEDCLADRDANKSYWPRPRAEWFSPSQAGRAFVLRKKDQGNVSVSPSILNCVRPVQSYCKSNFGASVFHLSNITIQTKFLELSTRLVLSLRSRV